MSSGSSAEKAKVNERGEAIGIKPDCLVTLAWGADSWKHACTCRSGTPIMKIPGVQRSAFQALSF